MIDGPTEKMLQAAAAAKASVNAIGISVNQVLAILKQSFLYIVFYPYILILMVVKIYLHSFFTTNTHIKVSLLFVQ